VRGLTHAEREYLRRAIRNYENGQKERCASRNLADDDLVRSVLDKIGIKSIRGGK